MKRGRGAGRNLKASLALLGVVCVAISCRGQEQLANDVQPALKESIPHRFGHYIRTHKLPLAAGAAVTLADSADAVSTLRAERYCPTCIDESLGRHPSPAKVWFNTQLASAFVVPFNLLAYHHYDKTGSDPSKFGQKFFTLFLSVPLAIKAAADADANSQIGPHSADLTRQRLSGPRDQSTVNRR